MTITSETMRQPPQSGNGVTTSFDYSFKIFDDDDLLVILVDSDGVETVQTKTTHYTVTGVDSESGGTVDFVTAPATGETVHIILDPAFTQTADLNANEYEKIFDKVVQMNQRVKDIAGRALRVSDGDGTDLSKLELTLGNDKILGTNSSGEVTALTLADIEGLTSVTAPLTYSGGVLGLSSTAPQNKTDATSPPTASHDSSLGYSYLSRWGGPTLDEVWVCLDDSVGAAVWVLTTGALASLDTVDTAQIDDNAVVEAKINDAAITTSKILDSAITTSKILDSAITADKLGSDVAKILQVKTFSDSTNYTRTGSGYTNMGNAFTVTPLSSTSSCIILWTMELGNTESTTGDDLGFTVHPHYYRGSDSTYYAIGHQVHQVATNLDSATDHLLKAGNSTLCVLDSSDDRKTSGDWSVRLRGTETYSGTGTIYEQQAIAIEVEL